MTFLRTDLAFEAGSFYLKQKKDAKNEGITIKTHENDFCSVTDVLIENETAAAKIQKSVGRYITIKSPHISYGTETERLCKVFAESLSSLFPSLSPSSLIFVVGLGNSKVTPDALGPDVLRRLIVTRHFLSDKDKSDDFLHPLCALSPGVLGITGIETAEIVKSVSEKVKPDLIIAIDALASRSPSHVGETIQLSDTGINPGSGVNNRRNALNEKTLGVPVIAVGVPTVSDSSSILYDAVYNALSKTNMYSDAELDEKASEIVSEKSDSMMVSPKNIDAVIERSALIISRGINMAVHPSLSYSEVVDYTS